jgi:secreted trypsin-like serine protease
VTLIAGWRFACGGSLLSKTFVLSAAHCTENIKFPRELTISMGSNYYLKEKGATHVKAVKIFDHPKYNVSSPIDFDFTLIQIQNIRHFPKHVTFAKLPEPTDELKAGDVMLIAGHGETELGMPLVLMGGAVPVLDHKACIEHYQSINFYVAVTDAMICAGPAKGGTKSCRGDSGGALRRKSDDKIFGITSWGLYPCIENPIVYAKISTVLDWIKEIAFA